MSTTLYYMQLNLADEIASTKVRPYKLARQNANLSGEFRVSMLPRLAGYCVQDSDSLIKYSLSFVEIPTTKVICKVAAELTLGCQHCLQPISHKVEINSELIIGDEKRQICEIVPDLSLSPHDTLAIAELVEEEVILALPLVPRHKDACIETKSF